MWEQSEKNIYVFGHRGAKALYPENTMLSFQKAIELGVDGIEMDLNMTKDGHLAVIHDSTVDRTTDKTGYVKDFTLKELQMLDAGKHFNEEFVGEKIPSFEEFLDLVKGKNLLLNVEIKDFRACVVDKAIETLERYDMSGAYVITCFDAGVTTYAHRTYGVKTQGFPVGYLKSYTEGDETHYYSVGIGMKDLTRDCYKKQGIDPWCWCPDDEGNVRKAIACGATLTTCNNPVPALTILKEKGLHS